MQGSKRPPMSAGEVLGASPRGIPDPGPLPPPSQKSEPPPREALNYPARTLRPPPTSNTVIFLAQGKTLHCDYFPWEVLDCLGPREPPPHASRLTRRGQSPQGLCHLTGSPHRVTSVPSPGFQGHLTEAARTLPISPAGSIVPARKSSIPYAASLAYRNLQPQPQPSETLDRGPPRLPFTISLVPFSQLERPICVAAVLFHGAPSWLAVRSAAQGIRWPSYLSARWGLASSAVTELPLFLWS